MLHFLFLQPAFNKFKRVFIDNGLDLQYKKPTGFLSDKSFLNNGVKLQTSQAKCFLYVVS